MKLALVLLPVLFVCCAARHEGTQSHSSKLKEKEIVQNMKSHALSEKETTDNVSKISQPVMKSPEEQIVQRVSMTDKTPEPQDDAADVMLRHLVPVLPDLSTLVRRDLDLVSRDIGALVSGDLGALVSSDLDIEALVTDDLRQVSSDLDASLRSLEAANASAGVTHPTDEDLMRSLEEAANVNEDSGLPGDVLKESLEILEALAMDASSQDRSNNTEAAIEYLRLFKGLEKMMINEALTGELNLVSSDLDALVENLETLETMAKSVAETEHPGLHRQKRFIFTSIIAAVTTIVAVKAKAAAAAAAVKAAMVVAKAAAVKAAKAALVVAKASARHVAHAVSKSAKAAGNAAVKGLKTFKEDPVDKLCKVYDFYGDTYRLYYRHVERDDKKYYGSFLPGQMDRVCLNHQLMTRG